MTNLYTKIAAVSRTVGSLETDKTNQQQRYDYISADKILSVVGKAMAEAGLVIVPTIISQTVYDATSPAGKKFFDAEVGFMMIVSDGGDATIEALWVGRGSDYSVPDKAVYKAITSGHKYFLMKLFNIGVGNEDGEHDDAPPATKATQRKQTANRPVPPPPNDSPFDDEPRSAASIIAALQTAASQYTNPAKEGQLKYMRSSLSNLVGNDKDKAKAILAGVFMLESSADATSGQASAIIDWVGATKENNYTPLVRSVQEAELILSSMNE